MPDREKVIKALEFCTDTEPVETCFGKCPYAVADDDYRCRDMKLDALELLKEQDELLKHEYWRGYNNGRADERGLQEGTIMQTFSPD